MEASITERLKALQEMNLGELRGEFEKIFGRPSVSRNRKVLVKRIAEKIQADAATPEALPAPLAKPTLTVRFERKGNAKGAGKAKKVGKAKSAKPRPAGQRDPRLPKVGTSIDREYKGRKLLVRVLEQGFEFEGKPYRSLSALAKHVTGSIWNGYLFFGLLPKVADPAKGGEGKKN